MIKSWNLFRRSKEDEIASICKKYCIRNWSLNKEGLVDVDWYVDLSHKKINKLPLNFEKVSGSFLCNNNLINLDGLVIAKHFSADKNQITLLTKIGQTMIDEKISFIEAVTHHLKGISDNELELILNSGIDPQKILELNNFQIFNILRTRFPKKYAEVMSLRDVDLSADLDELGF